MASTTGRNASAYCKLEFYVSKLTLYWCPDYWTPWLLRALLLVVFGMNVVLCLLPNSLYLMGVNSFWLHSPAGVLVGVAYLVRVGASGLKKGLQGDSDKFWSFISLDLLLTVAYICSNGLFSRLSAAFRCLSVPSWSNIDFLANLFFSKFSLSCCCYLNLAVRFLCCSRTRIFWKSLPSKLFTFVRSVFFLGP